VDTFTSHTNNTWGCEIKAISEISSSIFQHRAALVIICNHTLSFFHSFILSLLFRIRCRLVEDGDRQADLSNSSDVLRKKKGQDGFSFLA
jgi:hypothetical protein